MTIKTALLTTVLMAGLLFGGVSHSRLSTDQSTLLIEGTDGHFWQGEPTELLVIASGAKGVRASLQLPKTSDFLMTRGTPVKLNRNGVTETGYPVQLMPLKAGALTLPPLRLTGTPELSTAQQILNVKAPTLSDDITIRVHRSSEDIYLGQSIRLKFEWITRLHPRALRRVNILIPEMAHPSIHSLEPANHTNKLPENPIGLPVGYRRITGRWEALAQQQVRISFDYILHPQQAGHFEFPAPVLLASIDRKILSYRKGDFNGMRYPPHFDNNFFEDTRHPDSPSVQRVMAVATPFQLTVRPLPEGAPAHFSGAVGRPDVAVLPHKRRVRQGEALKLEFRIEHPDLEVFPSPTLNHSVAFNRLFDTPVTPDPVSYENGNKIIRQTVFPASAEINEIPPLSISYFDPGSRQYRDYTTTPVPLTVVPVTQFNFHDSELPDELQLSNQVLPNHQGVWAHLWGRSLYASIPADNRLTALLFMLLLLAPPTLFLLAFIPAAFQYWQRYRANTSIGQLRAELLRGSDPFTHLGLYLSRSAGMPPTRLNIEAIRDLLNHRQIDEDLIDRLCLWLEAYQQRFTEWTGHYDPPHPQTLIQLLEEIHRQLPKRLVTDTEGANR